MQPSKKESAEAGDGSQPGKEDEKILKEFLEDEAETHIVTTLEERRRRASSSSYSKLWTDAVEGEEPPFGHKEVNFGPAYDLDEGGAQQTSSPPTTRRSSLWDQLKKVRAEGRLKQALLDPDANKDQDLEEVMETLAERVQGPTREEQGEPEEQGEHETTQDKQSETPVFEGVGTAMETAGLGNSHMAMAETDADRLITGALTVDRLFREQHEDDASTVASMDSCDTSTARLATETLPLTGGPPRRSWLKRWLPCCWTRSMLRRKRKRLNRRLNRWANRRGLAEMFRPISTFQGIGRLLLHSFIVMVTIPATAAAFCMYYAVGHPELDFLPDRTSASWWLLFMGLQAVTLDLARLTQWFLVDCVALRSRLAVRLLGPLVTLFVIQAQGWPFLAVSWSILDLFLLHGDNVLQQSWFHYWELDIFGDANMAGGNDILKSDLYLRCLLALLVAGLAAAIKRTQLAMYFGRRTFVTYKPRLEKLLADVVLVTDVAKLAAEAQYVTRKAAAPGEKSKAVKKGVQKTIATNKWSSVRFESKGIKAAASFDTEGEESDEKDDSQGGDLTSEEDGDSESDDSSTDSSVEVPQKVLRQVSSRSGATMRVTNLLDRWDEPVNKLDKTLDASIHDVLKFRQALTYLDEEHPFGITFGPAATRHDCIRSSQKVYHRLMKLADGQSSLPFHVLKILALNEDDEEIEFKTKALKKIFRPDMFDELPLIAFVQSCDSVYKRIRYFRASVGNSSVIDKVLQSIINTIFYFLLALLTLAVLNINPWQFLLSLTTLMVSFAFALGPSTSRIIEGIMLIIRRPYDLGDRIVINGSENVVNYGVGYSWFVEDINLFNTTLRFGDTNEIAVVSNGSIAQSRIVNCQRSEQALVTLELLFLASNATEEKLSVFRESVEKFVNDRPRQWDSMAFFRCDEIDTANESYLYRLRARHTRTWQDAAAVLASRSELLKFCYELTKKIDIVYDMPVPGRRLYFAGEWRDEDYSQIRNRHDDNFGISRTHEHRPGQAQRLSPSMTHRSGTSGTGLSGDGSEHDMIQAINAVPEIEKQGTS